VILNQRHTPSARRASCDDHRTCTVPGTTAPCPPHPLATPQPASQQAQSAAATHSSLRIRWHLVNSRSSRLKHPARAKAGRNPDPPPFRRDAQDRSLVDFLSCLMTTSHWCVPLIFSGGPVFRNVVCKIPDEVTDYYLQRVGFDLSGCSLVSSPSIYLIFTYVRLRSRPESVRKRLLALAAQKFVSDIAADAYQHARIRTNAAGGRARANQGPGLLKGGLSPPNNISRRFQHRVPTML